MINTIVLEGYMTADAEVLFSKDGKPYCKFSIGVSDNYGDNKKVYFFGCVVFGNSANFMGEFIRKGDLVSLNGKLTQDRWNDENNRTRSSIGIVVNQIFILKKKDMTPKAKPPEATPATAGSFEDKVQAEFSDFENDIPF